MNTATIAVKSVLSELGILSEESKQKVCIITDIVKLAKMKGQPAPTSDQFNDMYDLSLQELQLLEQMNLQEHHHGVFTKMFYHK